jgi:hypothetical protein
MKTPDAQLPGHSAFLVETEETPENFERDPDAPEPTAEGNVKTKCSFDRLYSPSIGAVTKIIACKNFGQYRYCLIIWNI